MIRSMTGFAAITRETPRETVNITVKSVNHRFLDVALKAPSSLAVLESRIRPLVQQRVSRGRIELAIAADVTTPAAREVVVDHTLIEAIDAALSPARDRGLVTGGFTPADLLRMPDVIEIRARAPDSSTGSVPTSLGDVVEDAVLEALDALVVMRETEGRFIGADLENRLATIRGYVDQLTIESAQGQRQLEMRLRERLAELPIDLQGDAAAVARELVRFVSRSDIDEEVVRMHSHLEHWRALAGGPEPCGRKLDFLVQEMNREINTIGSKVESARATEIVIASKAELERIREQVQNVE